MIMVALPAVAAPAIPVRGGAHADYNRLVFDFSRAPSYQVQKDSGKVALTFDGAFDLAVNSSVRGLRRVGSLRVTQQDNRTVVSFVIPQDGSIKYFLSGQSVVLDVRGDAALTPATSSPPADSPSSLSTPTLPDVTSPAMTPVPSTPTVPAPNTPSPTPEVSAPPAPALETSVEVAPAPVPTPATAPPPPIMNVTATPTVLAQFDPRLSIPTAVYARGDYVYIAFDRRLRFDIRNLFPTHDAVMVEEIPVTAFSAYRVPLPRNASPVLSKQESRWQVDVVATGTAVHGGVLDDGLAPRSDPLYSLGARVVIPLMGGGQIVSFIDPVAGDPLIVVPTAMPGDRIINTRRYADFELLPTLQGVLIRPLIDDLRVRMIEEGIEITSPHGLKLSLGNPQLEMQQRSGAAPGRSREEVIPISRWRQEGLGDYTETRQALMQRVADAVPANRDRARIDLARFFLSHAQGQEALGVLKVVAVSNPDIADRPEFQLLRALGFILNNNSDQGLKALEAAGSSERDEIRLWRAVGLAQQRRFTEAAADFSPTMLLLEEYPSPFAERFAQLAAESFIAVADDANAARMIDVLVNRSSTKVLREPSILYLRGVMQARSGAYDQARDLWRQAAASDDYLSRVRAELALVDLEVSTSNMTITDAVRKLEGLRFAWRGDELEMEMLNRLAEYQVKANMPTEALETLERAKIIFPDSVREEELLNKQRDVFQNMFLNPTGAQQTPMQIVSIYEKYKNFSPVDDVQRQKIVNGIVDQMMAIDLLPQAVELLLPELDKAPTSEAKSKMILRLGAIYLLNGEPAKAAAIVQKLDDTELNTDLAQQKKLLTARALSDQDRNTEALQLLAGDTSADAMRLASTAAWRAKDWVRAAEALAYIQPAIGTTLDADAAQLVVARAVALSLANDNDALKKLNADYAPAMAQTEQAQTFAILADANVVGGAASLRRIQEQSADVDLFQKFLDSYKKTK
jgi:hypothetical protein